MLVDSKNIHLTGIKGVAMTSIAQCLLDMGKTLTGSDVQEDFVTKDILNQLNITITSTFQQSNISSSTDLVIYTAAHGGPNNPEVVYAQEQGIPTLSQAEALAELCNTKKGIAVCGVGGKSTTSAMIVWILEQLSSQNEDVEKPSFSVGVGKIVGMKKTGRWNERSDYFIVEADEYVIDPKAKKPTPRFSFLRPQIIVCTNLAHDHPDVYPTFKDTKKAYTQFFLNVKKNGILIINNEDEELQNLATKVKKQRRDISIIPFPNVEDYKTENKKTVSTFHFHEQKYTLELKVPGKFNVQNALAALTTTFQTHNSIISNIQALQTFQSTQRRFENIGEKNGVLYYDDYAHHPSELLAVTKAFAQWESNKKRYLAFQPHTYSRTKQLLNEFVHALSTIIKNNYVDTIFLLDIFASAREDNDPSISSDILLQRLYEMCENETKVINLHSLENLAYTCKEKLQKGNALLTAGAGNIYKVHKMI